MNKTFVRFSGSGQIAESEAQELPLAVVHYLVGRRSQGPGGSYVVSPEERQRMIAEAAYFRAQARGFGEGLQLEDWLAAEREIQQQLEASRDNGGESRTLNMPSCKPAKRVHVPSNLGLAERRTQPSDHHEPERRRASNLARPAAGQK
ncbi:DUF2934 domain-containing protein [Thermithiobacillus plumbiphilus]|uniref:DUF2934 domain-containing protein n=1 Tax=Thermithiobacillus plumbiphilus TaxID=1729899 RepID=A0ABU9D685_9PROT